MAFRVEQECLCSLGCFVWSDNEERGACGVFHTQSGKEQSQVVKAKCVLLVYFYMKSVTCNENVHL